MVEISQTGDQMLSVLETVARAGPVSAADVARLCDINRTVAHRLLTTLAERSYVRRGPDGYTLGPLVLQLARTVERDLSAAARPVMQKLAAETGETVVLHAVAGTDAVVVDQALGQRHLVRVEHRPGSRHPLVKGASGWALLAFQDGRFVERVLRKATDPEAAQARIETVRREGFAISHDELQLGVHGVAVPILAKDGGCEASLAILVPAGREGQLPSLAGPLAAAAREISRSLA